VDGDIGVDQKGHPCEPGPLVRLAVGNLNGFPHLNFGRLG
jgi:hypothetical protein